MRRVLDVALGSILMVGAIPVMVVLAVALTLDLRAWPVFTQDRVGRGGRPFRFVKLRTLPPTTPAYALKHTLQTVPVSRLRERVRKQHLDELPQLALVLTGAMSLVGPRPKMPDAHEPVDPVYRAERLRVAPGCTGLWQIGAHTDGLPSDAPEYDLFYVQHANVRLDVWILWRTLLKMVGLERPVELEDVPSWALRADGPTPVALRRRLRRSQMAAHLREALGRDSEDVGDTGHVIVIPDLETRTA